MKPNSLISRQPGRHDEEISSSQLRSTCLSTDYFFQAQATELQTGRARTANKLAPPAFAPGFRDLSNKFLGAETTLSYVAEVVFFAIIVGVSAWPIVSMAQALARLIK